MIATMRGADQRLGRLFGRESRRAFVVAVDHGLLFGVPPGAEDVEQAVERIVGLEPDGVLLGPGTLARTGHHFAAREAPLPLLRADWLVMDERVRDLGEHYRVLCTPAEAAELGAEMVVHFLVLGPEPGAMFADNARAVARAAQDAHRVGLPLMVETVPWGTRITDKRDPDLLAFGCRMAAELGADAIKTEYTGDPETMAQVVAGVPAPVLVLGGPRVDSAEDLVESTRGAMAAGARGVVYGRNVWQAEDPSALGEALRSVVHAPVPVGGP